jgi:hypothetical protein
MNTINLSEFKKFTTSSGIENNVVGKLQNKVVRIFRSDIKDYKEVISFSNGILYLISAKISFEDNSLLVVEHEPLEFITYYDEWTKRQKVEAAIAIIMIQKELSVRGFYLFDPHVFNITFKNAEPVYFDFGSIKKDKISPSTWFLKNFCGGFTKDYWDSVLKIGKIQKSLIAFRLLFSSSPYDLLIKIISRHRENILQKIILFVANIFPKSLKILKLLFEKIPSLNSLITNWSDYKQKDPLLINESPRVNNFIKLITHYNPAIILDLGANKGAYSKLSLTLGVKKAVCADLDENSLNILREDIRKNNLPIWTAKLNLMEYSEKPGCYGTYQPAHERLHAEFCICLAVVHHLSYFGEYSFEQVAERFNRFADKILIVEFIPSNDVHLSGAIYKGKDRSWYTTENFIRAMKVYFSKDHEIFESDPSPRILIKFEK